MKPNPKPVKSPSNPMAESHEQGRQPVKQLAGPISLLLLHVPSMQPDFVVRISVLASGKMLLDGNESNVPEVKSTLGKARSERAVVWYYREGGKGEPPQAMEVIKLVIENKLPISMSSKPDFSDYIDIKANLGRENSESAGQPTGIPSESSFGQRSG
jgi:hypothetical protein